VPVQLADAAAGEAHVDAGNLLRDGEIGLGDLARPAAVLDAPRLRSPRQSAKSVLLSRPW
jgi:hypothetical protein